MKSKWPAKLLLFGEYAVLHEGGEALGFPLEKFHLQISEVPKGLEISQELREKLTHLSTKVNSTVWTQSNIPMHIGLGSSAALCNALWAYAYESDESLDPKSWFEGVKTLEDVIHGTSSGVDCMLSAAKGAIHLQKTETSFEIYPVDLPRAFGLTVLKIRERHLDNRLWIQRISGELSKVLDTYMMATQSGINAFVASDRARLTKWIDILMALQVEVGMVSQEDCELYRMQPHVLGVKGIGAGGCLGVISDRPLLDMHHEEVWSTWNDVD